MRILEDRYKLCTKELSESQRQLQESLGKLGKGKEAAIAADEKIQKLERRLIFVTKASSQVCNI